MKCANCNNEFIIEDQDKDFYNRIKVPEPTWCPECRLIRRLSYRNERSLYKRKCEKCNKNIISVYSPDKPHRVYCSPCWWSDDWDGLEHGVDFDPNKPFLLQVKELLLKIPLMNLFSEYTSLVNCEYTNMIGDSKNCYLVTHSDFNEDCAYSSFVLNSKDCVDNLMIDKCELCYENVNCQKCYETMFSSDCEACNNSYFCKNCIGCNDCFGCVNLRNKQHYIFNKPYTKEEYQNKMKEYNLESSSKIQEIREKALNFWNKFPQKYIHEKHNYNVSGDYIYNCKNTHDSFIVTDTENCRYCALITPPNVKDCYDFSHYGSNAELVYDSFQVGNQVSKILFSWFAISGSREIEYSMFSIGSENLFGCVGLKKRQYCILNKQYSKDEYMKLREKIIQHMNDMPYTDSKGREYKYGEYFPAEFSPFCYNETTVQETFPLTKEQAVEKGYKWKDPQDRDIQITMTDIPDTIKEVKDDITKQIIECKYKGDQCTTAFKIIPQELDFYRRMNLPLPKLCPNCRHTQRIKQRNPLKLWDRKCDKCKKDIKTSYAPSRPEIVYCEECYKREVN